MIRSGCAKIITPFSAGPQNRDKILNLVNIIGITLQYVDDSIKDEEICLAAVKQNGEALRYVPDILRTRDMCLEAVTKDGLALAYVPGILRTEEMCMAAAKQNRRALIYVTNAEIFTQIANELKIETVMPEMTPDGHYCLLTMDD